MRKAIVAGNWKMFKTVTEAVEFATALKAIPGFLADAELVESVICPPYLQIPALAEAFKGTPIRLGAQNVHHKKDGAYTSCISAGMLQGLVEYVIVGHSEVRRDLGDTDERVNEKAKVLLESGLKPIIAVGESLTQRQEGITKQVVDSQVTAAFNGIAVESIPHIVIAYEPIWAIGTGLACDTAEANKVIADIRALITTLYDAATGEAIRIQYGGSVNPGNMASYMAQPDIDGGLVGGASLKVDDYVALVRHALQAKG